MGQKVNPIAFRVGVIREWDSIWWNEKNLGNWVVEDELIRRHIMKKFRKAEVARVKIERNVGIVKVIIYTGKPAFLIGQKGNEIDLLKKDLTKIIEDKSAKIDTKIEEVRKITSSAQILACNLALQIERNFPYKRAMKKIMADVQRDGIKGIKIKVSGRLGGAEMARDEWYAEGRIPTQTIRADIDYASETAHTKYGCIGVKIWLFRGEVIDRKDSIALSFLGGKEKTEHPKKAPTNTSRKPKSTADSSKAISGKKTDAETPVLTKKRTTKSKEDEK